MWKSIVDLLKAIPDTLKFIPDDERLAALAVIVVLVTVVVVLRSDILGGLPRGVRAEAVLFIVRYVFVGAACVIALTFYYAISAKKLQAAEIEKSLNQRGPGASPISQGKPAPIVPLQSTRDLADALVVLAGRFGAPAGVADALVELKNGNKRPAIDILNKVLATETDSASRAETLRWIGLLEFYDDTQASLAAYEQSVQLDPGSWQGDR
jgi:hypothetical protein